MMIHTATLLAELKGVSGDEIATATTKNFHRLFLLPGKRGKLIELVLRTAAPLFKEKGHMAQENSFDIVSKVEIQEVRNAIDQALKEIKQRFDLKDSHTEIDLVEGDKEIQMASASEYKLEAVKEILGQKLIKRGVSLKNLTYGKVSRLPDRA